MVHANVELACLLLIPNKDCRDGVSINGNRKRLERDTKTCGVYGVPKTKPLPNNRLTALNLQTKLDLLVKFESTKHYDIISWRLMFYA